MKRKDPTIDRIRQARHEISREFDHDPRKLVDHYIELQQQYEDRLLETPRKKSLRHAPEQS